MGREIVYCWKCATLLKGTDFEAGTAYRVGDKVSCPDCVEELVADLSAEEQEAILQPPKRKEKSQSIKKATGPVPKAEEPAPAPPPRKSGNTSVRTRTGSTGPVTKVRTGTTGPVPTASTGVRKRVTSSIPKAEPPPAADGEEGAEDGSKPPMDPKKKKILVLGGVGGGLFLVIVVLVILVVTKKAPPKKTAQVVEEDKAAKAPVVAVENPKEKQIKTLLKDAFDLKAKEPDALGPQLKKFEEARAAAKGTLLEADVESAYDDMLARIDKAVGAVDAQVKDPWTANDFKAVIETYEKAKSQHDFPEWKDKIEKKLGLARNKMDDVFFDLKKKAETEREEGKDDAFKLMQATIAKWESKEHSERLEKFAQLLAAAEPADPGKPAPDAPVRNAPAAAARPLTPAMKAFMPQWTEAILPALGRDFGSAATALTGAGARAESVEIKKAAADDAQALKDLGELYPEVLKTVAQTAKLQTFTLEYQDQPGVWKKVTGKATRVEPARLEFQPDTPKDAKPLPPILIEYPDLNAGSLADLYKAKKKTLPKKEADLLARFCLLEGAPEAAKATGGSAPDRFWHFAPEAREKAPKPNSREFEARILFHQSEFEWRKPLTRYNAIEKSKLLIGDYTSTAIVQKNKVQIAMRAETGKEFTLLPAQMAATGDFNQFKMKKDDPAWVTSKDIDFQNSLYNYVEAEFIALPNVSYKCWVYAGGCCQEVWNGSYQLTEATTKNKGKDVPIDAGSQMAAPLPMPGGLKKTHDDHKPKGVKSADHALTKSPAKWDWISIPLPKTFPTPGTKQLRLLTDQQGFGVKYVLISSTRTKAPDATTAADLAKEALSAPAPKSDVKGSPQPNEWFIIGPFPEGLAKEEGPENGIDLGAELKGKTGAVKWKISKGAMAGAQCKLDWEKGVFNPKDNVSAYALIHVKAPAAMDARLYLSHDDGGRAWLNGARVHDNNKNGAVKADEFNVALKLEEGWNRLLFKVTTGGSGFGLLMRITDPNKAAIPGLEYSPYGDSLDPQ